MSVKETVRTCVMTLYKSGCCLLSEEDEGKTLNGQVRMPWIRYSVEYDSIVYMEEDQDGGGSA